MSMETLESLQSLAKQTTRPPAYDLMRRALVILDRDGEEDDAPSKFVRLARAFKGADESDMGRVIAWLKNPAAV